LHTGFFDRGGSLTGPGRRFRTGLRHDRHDLHAGLNRLADSHGLLNSLDIFVCPAVDVVEVLAQAVQQPADFFRHACHGEILVRAVDILARTAGPAHRMSV
jgi:hypothetical protein